MRQLISPVLLIGLADSLNPATIAVAVFLATQRQAIPRLVAFALGTGLTYFVGGLALTLGPAALLQSIVHHHAGDRTRIAEVVAGAVALAVAAWLWTRPAEKIARRVPEDLSPLRAFLLAAGITLVDLPTALPYFGAILLIVAADVSDASRIILLVIFNVAYVAPLLAITILVAVLGKRVSGLLERVRDMVTRWSARILALITGASGCYLLAVGGIGLAG
jgi:cytochrome c biogenesis protein CcdA